MPWLISYEAESATKDHRGWMNRFTNYRAMETSTLHPVDWVEKKRAEYMANLRLTADVDQMVTCTNVRAILSAIEIP